MKKSFDFWLWLDRAKLLMPIGLGILVLLFCFSLLIAFRHLESQILNQGKYAVLVNKEQHVKDSVHFQRESAQQATISALQLIVARQGTMIEKDSMEKAHLHDRASQNEKLIVQFGQAYSQMATHNQHLLDSINGSLNLSLDQQKIWAKAFTDTSLARRITDEARKSLKGTRKFKNEFLDLDIYLFDDSTYVTGKVYDRREQRSEVLKKISALGIARPIGIQSTLTSLNPYIQPHTQSDKLPYLEQIKNRTKLRENKHRPKAPTKEPKR
jgi:hypothetical protein